MKRIGYATLGGTDRQLASTRITVLNTIPLLQERGFVPEIVSSSSRYDPNRSLDGFATTLLEKGYGPGDTAYFQSLRSESAREQATILQEHGVRTIFGVCNYVDPSVADICDATIVPSRRLKGLYPERLQHKVFVVHDGIEVTEPCKREYAQARPKLQAVFMTGKRYSAIRGTVIASDIDLSVIGPYGEGAVEGFRTPRWSVPWEGVRTEAGIAPFERTIWTPDSYTLLHAYDIGILPIDLEEPMARPDMAPTSTRSANKLTQKMALGLPVIAGPLPAYTEIIEQGLNGFIVRDDAEWLEAFRILRDPAQRRRIGMAGRESVMGRFSKEAQVERLCDVLDSLLGIHVPDEDEDTLAVVQ